MTAYFSNLFGFPIFDASENNSGICVYSFTLRSINNQTGTDCLFGSDIGSVIGLLLYLADAQTISVSLEGRLTRSATGTVLAESKITESFNTKRSFFGRKFPSLPMIEVAAVKLLKMLRQEALL
ncbi:hypothetical protein [Roseibium sp.]|uniref:hypothetical protein n=1 Tax=Roseibium sp. TaxID=1936156 RepID=UPI003D1255AF